MRELYLRPPESSGSYVAYCAIREIAPELTNGLSSELLEERDILRRIRGEHCKRLEFVRFAPAYAWTFDYTEQEWHPVARPLTLATKLWNFRMAHPRLPEEWYP